jgi:arsenite methyltransferase
MTDEAKEKPIEGQSRPEGRGLEARYFEFLAGMGITKHMGSMHSTEALIEACNIGPGHQVLDIGCGVGITPCYLAKRIDCRVVGIDITPQMIAKSQARAKQMGVAKRVEFRVADARDLPFDEGAFDAVIVESLLVFLAEKEQAIREFTRVCKAGGFVGLNEMTLLQEPAPPKLVAYFEHTTGMKGPPPTVTAWRALLESAGLEEVTAQGYQVTIRDEAKGRLKRFRFRDYTDSIGWLLRMYITDSETREFLKQISTGTKLLTRDLFESLGYGISVGRKGRPSAALLSQANSGSSYA